MVLQLSNEKVHPFNFHLDAGVLMEDGDEFEGRVTEEGLDVQGELIRKNRMEIRLLFTLTGTVSYVCARCLDPVVTDVAYHYDESIELPEEIDAIDLVPYVNECLFINEPFRVLCHEDCKGLCPVCGVNLNYVSCDCEETLDIDLRFEALKQLL